MDSPETWQWIWLVAALTFGLGEMATAGSFFLLPFAFGAVVATGLAYADVSVNLEWAAFVVVSGATFAAMRPLARRLDAELPGLQGVGADRWTGREGVVLTEIPSGPDSTGSVRLDREEWRAASEDGTTIAADTTVTVVRVEGTRVVVTPRKD